MELHLSLENTSPAGRHNPASSIPKCATYSRARPPPTSAIFRTKSLRIVRENDGIRHCACLSDTELADPPRLVSDWANEPPTKCENAMETPGSSAPDKDVALRHLTSRCNYFQPSPASVSPWSSPQKSRAAFADLGLDILDDMRSHGVTGEF